MKGNYKFYLRVLLLLALLLPATYSLVKGKGPRPVNQRASLSAYSGSGETQRVSQAVPVRRSRLDPTNEPEQILFSETESIPPIRLEKAGYTWTMFPRARYQITARVLLATEYDDWQSNFTPVDVALGWGNLSTPAIDGWVHWWHSERWYYYRFQNLPWGEPNPREYIRDHSANVHVIPATAEVDTQLRQLKRNDVVLMEGMLVDVEAIKDGQSLSFRTSLSRNDSDANSCEIFYVERLIIG